MNFENKNIIIIGGTGDIGSHLVRSLDKLKANIFILTRPQLTDKGSVKYPKYENSNLAQLTEYVNFYSALCVSSHFKNG